MVFKKSLAFAGHLDKNLTCRDTDWILRATPNIDPASIETPRLWIEDCWNEMGANWIWNARCAACDF